MWASISTIIRNDGRRFLTLTRCPTATATIHFRLSLLLKSTLHPVKLSAISRQKCPSRKLNRIHIDSSIIIHHLFIPSPRMNEKKNRVIRRMNFMFLSLAKTFGVELKKKNIIKPGKFIRKFSGTL